MTLLPARPRPSTVVHQSPEHRLTAQLRALRRRRRVADFAPPGHLRKGLRPPASRRLESETLETSADRELPPSRSRDPRPRDDSRGAADPTSPPERRRRAPEGKETPFHAFQLAGTSPAARAVARRAASEVRGAMEGQCQLMRASAESTQAVQRGREADERSRVVWRCNWAPDRGAGGGGGAAWGVWEGQS